MAVRQLRVGGVRWSLADQGQGPVILLVHGFPLDHSMWQGQLDGLADGCRLIAPDLPGFGQSQATLDRLSMTWYASRLAELLDHLQLRDPITLCGLSLGGYVAWKFWQHFADRLERLILCDTRAAADSPEAARNRLDQAQQVREQGTAVLVENLLPRLFAPQAASELIEATRQVMQQAPAASVAAALEAMAARDDMTPWLGDVQLPTLLVCGEHDRISPPEEMEALSELLPQAQFVRIARAGHMAPVENAAAVNQAIRQWLG